MTDTTNHKHSAPVHTPMHFSAWSEEQLARVENALSQWVGLGAPDDLAQAMRYAVLDGGKRLRPLLVLATQQSVHGNPQAGLRAACAVELIHAYSLVHDDMPCMDNDVLRRGKPTVHVKFGQASALLAGDALQALAFELLTPLDASVSPIIQARLCALLSRASGCEGMAGGQAIDLANVGRSLDEAQLRLMHALKTGALLRCSVEMGAACAEVSPDTASALRRYGEALGLAFQVVDDILDVMADAKTLGKTPGKDAQQHKPTYVSMLGLEQAQAYARQLHAQALDALHSSGLADTLILKALTDWVIQRQY